jgi:hypothetical protein
MAAAKEIHHRSNPKNETSGNETQCLAFAVLGRCVRGHLSLDDKSAFPRHGQGTRVTLNRYIYGPAFVGSGEMAAVIQATDWGKTAIGPAERWSPTLRLMVNFLLANRFPLLLWWGPEYVSIYNDAYRPILGAKHPRSIGLPCRECWTEIWHILKPLIDSPFTGGPPTWMDDLALEVNRHGYTEETHFTVAYSPVPDQDAPNGIGGVLATVHEISDKIVGERRIAALRDLASPGEAKTAEEACAIAATALARHPKDVPFALLYLIDPIKNCARLAGATGIGPREDLAPELIELDAPAATV